MTLLWAAAAAAAVTLTFALRAIHPAPALAASTVTVSTTADETAAGDGTCSLREATLYSNGTAEPDCAVTPPSGTTTIIAPAGVYVLSGTALLLSGDVRLTGAGSASTTVTAAGGSQVFVVRSAAQAAISDLAVTGGLTAQACAISCAIGTPLNGLPGGGILNAGTLTLTRVIVSGNRTSAGGINPFCNPAITACSGGTAGDGAGISNTGILTIASSTITANSTGPGASGTAGQDSSGGGSGSGGSGGGISNSGTLTISDTTITGNSTGAGANGAAPGAAPQGRNGFDGVGGGAGGSGGGIENSGRLVITGSTLAGNTTGAGGNGGPGGDIAPSTIATGGEGGTGGASGSGAGIDSSTETTISNATIASNRIGPDGTSGAGGNPAGFVPPPATPGSGGGINQRAMGSTLTHVTIASNTAAGAGGGIDGAGGTVTAANSILASNSGAAPNQNCAGVVTDQGGNLESGASSCPAGFVGADPRLGSLASNGGPTQTIALQPGSAAIHHVRTCVLATDQRGAARPVGAPCDSGAYQVAPPSVSGISAGTITTSSATIAASVNPNLRDTTVVVNYGLTPSHGSSTAPQDLGAGNAPVPFTAALTGLEPNKTYHFVVAATNGDGQTTTSDGTFTTLPPLTASITSASTLGAALRLTIACGGGSGFGTCQGTIRLTAPVAGKHRHKVKVAAGSYSVNSGGRKTVKIVLNRAGQTMLAQHYTLPARLSVRGTTPLNRGVTFAYRRIKADVPFTISFDGPLSVASELAVTGIPRGGRLTLTCRGDGCPLAKRTFQARHGSVDLGSIFKHARLHTGATLQFQVTAPNRVGFVETLVIRSGQKPTVIKQCLPPGIHQPTRCAAP